MTLRLFILRVVDFIFHSLKNGRLLGSVKKCSEIFSTPLGKLVPKLLPICLFVCLLVHRVYFFCLFISSLLVLLLVCLFASPLVCFLCLFICTYHCFFVQPWLVPDCVILLLSEIESCDTNSLYTVNTVLHCGSSSSLRFVMGEPQL